MSAHPLRSVLRLFHILPCLYRLPTPHIRKNNAHSCRLRDIIKVKKIETVKSDQPAELLPNTARRPSSSIAVALSALTPITPTRTTGGRESIRNASIFSNLSIETENNSLDNLSNKSAFEIQTSAESRHVGTTYVFRAGTEVECSEWVENMNKAVRVVRSKIERERRGTFNEKARNFLGLAHNPCSMPRRHFRAHHSLEAFVLRAQDRCTSRTCSSSSWSS